MNRKAWDRIVSASAAVTAVALFAGYALLALGIILGVLAFLGFRHSKRSETARVADATVIVDTKVPATASV